VIPMTANIWRLLWLVVDENYKRAVDDGGRSTGVDCV
jgi:hypothetical protein